MSVFHKHEIEHPTEYLKDFARVISICQGEACGEGMIEAKDRPSQCTARNKLIARNYGIPNGDHGVIRARPHVPEQFSQPTQQKRRDDETYSSRPGVRRIGVKSKCSVVRPSLETAKNLAKSSGNSDLG